MYKIKLDLHFIFRSSNSVIFLEKEKASLCGQTDICQKDLPQGRTGQSLFGIALTDHCLPK